MKYRPEIDGLRALAVLSVTVFHFFPQTLQFGFNGHLGVDIFFVISGFLIGKYIIKELNKDKFSFKQFYWRRVKRILPAAFTTLIVTTIAAIIILTPYDLAAYFKSQLAAISFTPNIYFWRVGGYFGDLDSLKPLLHFWSLGIEEQFYLFFPLTLYLIYKVLGQRFLLASVILISILSLCMNVFLLKIGGANPAFFLLPTRVWQFGFGCIAAIISKKISSPANPSITNVLLAILFLSFFINPHDSMPPGLIPSIATALLLGLSHVDGAAFRLLSSRFSSFFGKISFSFYLVHWPVVVFLGYIFIDEVPILYLLSSLLMVIFTSYLSYQYVEVPFRHNYDNRLVRNILAGAFIILLGISIIGINSGLLNIKSNTLSSKLSEQVQTNYRCSVYSFVSFGGSRACLISHKSDVSNTSIVLNGNSHAQMYVPAVKENLVNEQFTLVPLNSCLPTTLVNISQTCLALARENEKAILSLPKLKTIIIGMTWYGDTYFSNKGPATKKDLLDDIFRTIDIYKKRGIEVYVISPIPQPGFNHASIMSRSLKFGHLTQKEYVERSKILFDSFYKEIEIFDVALSNRMGDKYIKVFKGLCDDQSCFFGDLEGSYFADNNHISKYGLSKVAPMLNRFQ